MMVNQYKIRDDKGVYDHYEYMIERLPMRADTDASPFISGIALIEDYASKIVGERVCFFYFYESRCFSLNIGQAKGGITLDISLLKVSSDSYNIIAEITYVGEALMEIKGKVRTVEQIASIK